MKDGMVIFDSVVHIVDYRHEMAITSEGDLIREQMTGFLAATTSKGSAEHPEAVGNVPDLNAGPPDYDWCNDLIFNQSDTDLAMVQAVPLFGAYQNAMGPSELAYEYQQTRPDRLLFCGGVDPMQQGVKGALEEMERQVTEWGASTIKFYQGQGPYQAWRADDRVIAYPLWEKAQELGIKMVQFHKGLPLGRQPVEDFAPNDIQLAAYDFPDLNFGLHHLGHPYVDETIDIASRFGNVYLILPLLFNQWFLQPREMMHRFGKALFYCGDDRLCYGSDGFVWNHFQAYIDLLAHFEMPEDLQEGYGYPALTRDSVERIFGLNYARGLGLDLDQLIANAGEGSKKAGEV